MTWDSLSWEAKRGAVLAQALFVCEICGEAAATEVDHIWPRVIGGTDIRENLQAACAPCNRSKGGHFYFHEIESRPFLAEQGVSFQRKAAYLAAYSAVRYTLYAHFAGVLGMQQIQDALGEAGQDSFNRLADAIAEAIGVEVELLARSVVPEMPEVPA